MGLCFVANKRYGLAKLFLNFALYALARTIKNPCLHGTVGSLQDSFCTMYEPIQPRTIARSVEVMRQFVRDQQLQTLKRMRCHGQHAILVPFRLIIGAAHVQCIHFCVERLCVATQFDLPLCACPSQGALANKHLQIIHPWVPRMYENGEIMDFQAANDEVAFFIKFENWFREASKVGSVQKHQKHCPFKPSVRVQLYQVSRVDTKRSTHCRKCLVFK